MKTTTSNYYKAFRAAGETAERAHANAVIMAEFDNLQNLGVVELKAEAERENYFSVYGHPDDPREYQSICEQIENNGLWHVYSTTEGKITDSIGMIIAHNPLSPTENMYVPDLCRAAINEYYESIAVGVAQF